MSNRGRVWTRDEIVADCRESARLFALRRMNEPLADYLNEYASAELAAAFVIDRLPQILARPTDQAVLAQIIRNPAHNTAFRYLTAPPISNDDLCTVLGRRVTGSAIREDREFAEQLVELLRQTIDPKRFPWLAADRLPTDQELEVAKTASAVAATCQRVQTKRRGDEKSELEGAIVRMLDALGFQRIATPRGKIMHAEDLPKAGEYMVGATLGNDNGDCIIGLYDRRRLALECKSSNSEINSRKRLNKEVIKDAKNWSAQFGAQVLTAAALRGVYKPDYVREAQETPVMIIWEHRLDDLADFIASTR